MTKILFLFLFSMSQCSYAAPKACWTSEQDEQLIASIERHAGKSWSTIAAEVTGKVNKQCRERYMCHLDPMIDKSPLSDAEISTLELAVQELGPKWGKISKTLFTLANGKRRTDLHLKNIWHSQHRSEVGGRKSTASHKRHLEENFTTIPQQVFLALPSISSSRTNKKKKVLHSRVPISIFGAQPSYSSAPSGGPHLLSSSQLLLNGQTFLLPPSNVTHSGLVAPENGPIHPPGNSASALQPLSSSGIVLDTIFTGPELATIFEDDPFNEDTSILREFNIKTLDQEG